MSKPKSLAARAQTVMEFGPNSILTSVKINGVDRPEIKTIDEAIRLASELIWAEHPNNPANKMVVGRE